MSKRIIYVTYDFVNTESEAMNLCEQIATTYSPYMRRTYKAPHYTTWTSLDGNEHKYVVWYYYHI